MKEAIIFGLGEKSKHSKTHDLVGYLLYLADSKPLHPRTLWGASGCRANVWGAISQVVAESIQF